MSRIVVVGAGVVGLCTADALLRRGHQVTVVERDPNPGDGCSYGNGGLVVPSHFEPLASPGMVATGLRMLRSKDSPFGFSGVPGVEMASWMLRFARAGTKAHVERCAPILRDLNLASRRLYEERFSHLDIGYARRGELMLCRTEATLAGERRIAHEAMELGMRTEVLDRAALRAFDPAIEVDAAGAVYFEDDGHLTPSRFMPALRAQVLDAGGEIHDAAEVHGFSRDGRSVTAVRFGDREEPLDELVLAAGSWTGRVAAKLGLKIPLLAGKGYGFTVPNPPATPRYPAILVDGRVAVTPMVDGLRFVGTMELGLPGPIRTNEHRLRGMRRAIADFYPAFRGFNFDGLPVWAGLRPCAPDGMPILGRPGALANVVVATGHGMMGMSLGPISGELVAQIVDSQTPSVPLDLLSPNRYG